MIDKPPSTVLDEAQILARKHTEAAVDTLAAGLKSENPMVQIKSAEALLARGHGAPTQHVETKIKRDPSEITDSELAEIIARSNRSGSGDGTTDAEREPEQPSSVH